ncbi:unnamed protein product [Rotaria sordida]|uniref:Uncharacterized protein n=1 Tax=Rotaria sordida TaxID=392033 RepID=A0A815D126_9BILA|nr:unnamed protein product [Rotaria sordida]CAF3826816.1 unnamed protein product [Rotaria sordida]
MILASFTMAYAPLPSLDNLTIREWNELTSPIEKTINLCQRLGLLHVYPTKPCQKMHNNCGLVNGTAQGIGRAIALRLAKDGLNIAVNDIQASSSDLRKVQ